MTEQDTLQWVLQEVQVAIGQIDRYICSHQVYLPDPFVQESIDNATRELCNLRIHAFNLEKLLGLVPLGVESSHVIGSDLSILSTQSEVYVK